MLCNARNDKTRKRCAYTTSYQYDSANQLVRENNQAGGFTKVWTYDNAGNIRSRSEYAYTTGDLGTATDTVTYAYTSSKWGDMLRVYDGQSLGYDGAGNLISDGTWSYTWQHGRQLASMSNGSTTWTYTYDANGMRTSRTNGTTTYRYVYDGGQLVEMVKTSGNTTTTVRYTYDANGTPLAFTVNNSSVYYFVTNLQGDVTGILTAVGFEIVSYRYDAWGNVSATGPQFLQDYNPLLYRGYVYDSETQLYYLQSRYYDPEWGRFINADGLVTTGQGFIGNNMFAYCRNNPIRRKDISGTTDVDIFDDGDSNLLDDEKTYGGGKGSSDSSGNIGGNSSGPKAGSGSSGNAGQSAGQSTSNTQGSQNATDGKTFLPDEFYTKHAPKQSTPNSSYTQYTYNSRTGQYEQSTAYYDYAGRQFIRIDWTDHGYWNHGNPHVHMTFYNAQYRDGITVRWD